MTVYVAAGNTGTTAPLGLAIIDVTTPLSPSLAHTFPAPVAAPRLLEAHVSADSSTCIAEWWTGATASVELDVYDLTSMTHVGAITSPTAPAGVLTHLVISDDGSTAWAADRSSGTASNLWVIDTASVTVTTTASVFNDGSATRPIQLSADESILYFAAGSHGLALYDPTTLAHITDVALSGTPLNIFTEPTGTLVWVYFGSPYGVVALDVVNAYAVTRSASSVTLFAQSDFDLSFDSQWVFEGEGASGGILYCYWVFPDQAPFAGPTVSAPGYSAKFDPRGLYVYVATTGDMLDVCDVWTGATLASVNTGVNISLGWVAAPRRTQAFPEKLVTLP